MSEGTKIFKYKNIVIYKEITYRAIAYCAYKEEDGHMSSFITKRVELNRLIEVLSKTDYLPYKKTLTLN